MVKNVFAFSFDTTVVKSYFYSANYKHFVGFFESVTNDKYLKNIEVPYKM